MAVTFKLIGKKIECKSEISGVTSPAQCNSHQIAFLYFLLRNLSAQVDLKTLLKLNSNVVQTLRFKNGILGLSAWCSL